MTYNKILEKLILPIGDLLNNSSYIKQLIYWRRVDTYSEDKLEKLQLNNLKKILLFTTKNTDKYKHI